jgi:hypothetical protein
MAFGFLVIICGPERVSKEARKTLRSRINSLGRANIGGGEEQERKEIMPIKFLLRGSAYHQKLLSARNWIATYAKECALALRDCLSLILTPELQVLGAPSVLDPG